MKRLLFTTLFFVATILAKASNEPSLLFVKLQDGSTKEFVLAKKPNITFDSEKVFIVSEDFSAEYSKIDHIYFGNDEDPTSISEVTTTKSDFKFTFIDGHSVTIECITNPTVKVYSINGMSQDADITNNSSSITIELGSLPKGFYIIKVNSQAFKVYKK